MYASASWDAALARVAGEPDRLRARLLLAGIVSRVAKDVGFQPVVVGGTAVDFYASGATGSSARLPAGWRGSVDVDLVSLRTGGSQPSRRLFDALKRNGWTPDETRDLHGNVHFGRGVPHPRLPQYPLEIVSEELNGSYEHVVRISVDEFEAAVIGPEDVVVEHAEWGAHTRDQQSWTRALAVAAAQKDDLDLSYLRDRAAERGFSDAVEKVLRGEPLVR